MRYVIDDDVVLSRPPEGPLSAHIPAFARWAREQGYARSSRQRQVLLAAYFSRWLGRRGVGLRRVSSEHLTRYLRTHARRLQVHRGDGAALRQFRDFLRREGVIPAEKIAPRRLSAAERVAEAFKHYLRDERALAGATIANYVPFVRDFLADRFGESPVALSRLCADDVVRFVQSQTSHLGLKRAKLMTAALRSFLNYIRYRGDVVLALAAAVPVVANWSMSAIPRAIPPDSVRRLLAGIRRDTPSGIRDYAIVLLLARLGLRSGEVVRLELDDIDWNVGHVSVQGKGGQRTTLPLPADVGEAIAAYLQHGRPRSTSRRVFLRCRAPIRGFLSQCAIGSLIGHRLVRMGINAPTKGAHQFRHALATQMLRGGASLAEIGEVLRHRSPETTKIYTKVDLDALRTLALPWPRGVR